MILPSTRYKKISEIKGLENYIDYAVDIDGNVWSFKNHKTRILKPGWAKRKDGYLTVILRDHKSNAKQFYVHKLVALAFLPIPSENFIYRIWHHNGVLSDNRIDNLEWYKGRRTRIKREKERELGYTVEKEMANKIESVYIASIKKGLKVPDMHSFFNILMNKGLDEYINQYGLRRLLTN